MGLGGGCACCSYFRAWSACSRRRRSSLIWSSSILLRFTSARISGVRPCSSFLVSIGLRNWWGGRTRSGVVGGEFGAKVRGVGVAVEESVVEGVEVDDGVEGRRRGERKGAFTDVKRRRLGSRSSIAGEVMD